MKKYYNRLLILIERTKPDILILTEVDIVQNELNLYQSWGYNVIDKLRTKSKGGGGILVFVQSKFKIQQQKTFALNSFENVNVTIKANKVLVDILAIYRPPNKSQRQFVKDLGNILTQFENKKLIITGDMNINLNNAKHNIVIDYENLMAENILVNCIQNNTREVVRKDKTVVACLDHLFVKDIKINLSGIIKTTIADHYPIGLIFEVGKANKTLVGEVKQEKIIYVINGKKVDEKIKKENWKFNEIVESNVALLYQNFVAKMGKIYKTSMKKKVIKERQNKKPWITKEIKSFLAEKDVAYHVWKRNPENKDLKKKYNNYLNKSKKMINKERIMYERNELERISQDSGRVWRKTNELTGREIRTSVEETILSAFEIEDQNDIIGIANKFGETFVEEINKVKIKCNEEILPEVRGNSQTKFREWKMVDTTEVKELINEMDHKKSPGIDGIRMTDIKENDELIAVMTKIINLSLESSKVPDLMKISLVKPLFKKGQKTLFTSYRPIQILSATEKILEKVVHKQLVNYLEENNILRPELHGYRKNKSTLTLLQDFFDRTNEALEMRKQVAGLFIDLTKAFDTISKKTLKRCLELVGIGGTALQWFINYLTDRKIVVKLNDVVSEQTEWESGVPQGSLLGPVLYNVVANSLFVYLKSNNQKLMFADDKSLQAIADKIETAYGKLEKDFKVIQKWAHDFGLVINKEKTKILHIRSRGPMIENTLVKFHTHDCLHVMTGQQHCKCSEVVETVESIDYLGIIIDDRLTMSMQILKLNKRLRSLTFCFEALKNLASLKTKKTLYYALVESIVSYGIVSYGCIENVFTSLKSLQLRILKTMLSKKELKKLKPVEIYKHLNILPFDKLYIYRIIMLNKLKNFVDYNSLIASHKYNTRNKKRNVTEISNNKFGDRISINQLKTELIKIPKEIYQENKIGKFKKHFKNHLFETI